MPPFEDKDKNPASYGVFNVPRTSLRIISNCSLKHIPVEWHCYCHYFPIGEIEEKDVVSDRVHTTS